jgi:hypothetical protein
MSALNRLKQYLSLWLRPPRIANLEAEDIDGPTLPFVSPVFVLSTGRCGTKWLTELLRHDPRMWVNHSDYPELIRHSRLAYEQYEGAPHLFQEIVRATRDGYILSAHSRNQVYVETNNRITFFAHAIRAVYPQARFIHLVRHPGDFVRSGLRRGWYHGGRHDVGRIRDATIPETWEAMADIEKIAWLWNETNRYIEDFLATLDAPGSYLQVKAEDMFGDAEVGAAICKFAGASVSNRVVTAMLDRQINQQRIGSKPPYERWDLEEKQQVRQHALLGEYYRYEL